MIYVSYLVGVAPKHCFYRIFQRWGRPPLFLIGFSIINHPFSGTPIFGNAHIFAFVGDSKVQIWFWKNSIFHGQHGLPPTSPKVVERMEVPSMVKKKHEAPMGEKSDGWRNWRRLWLCYCWWQPEFRLTHQVDMVKYPIISLGFIHHRWLFGMSSINSMCR